MILFYNIIYYFKYTKENSKLSEDKIDHLLLNKYYLVYLKIFLYKNPTPVLDVDI